MGGASVPQHLESLETLFQNQTVVFTTLELAATQAQLGQQKERNKHINASTTFSARQ